MSTTFMSRLALRCEHSPGERQCEGLVIELEQLRLERNSRTQQGRRGLVTQKSRAVFFLVSTSLLPPLRFEHTKFSKETALPRV